MEHVFSALAVWSEVHLNIGSYLCRFVKNLHFIQQLFTAFRTLNGFFPVEGTELFNDLLLMLDFLLLFQISIQSSCAQLFLFDSVIGVVTKKSSSLCLINFYYFTGNPVEKIAVMGYDQNSSLIVEKIGFQPADGI